MIDAKKELQYRLAVRMLEHLAEIGLLSAEELSYAKRLAREKYSPQTVWEYMTHFSFVGTVFARISHTPPTNAATLASMGFGG